MVPTLEGQERHSSSQMEEESSRGARRLRNGSQRSEMERGRKENKKALRPLFVPTATRAGIDGLHLSDRCHAATLKLHTAITRP